MKYLITGITGFAGPNLANLLIREGHEVSGLVRSSNGRENDIRDIVPDENFNKINFIYGELKDFESLDRIFKEYRFDGAFHLAAQSHPPTSFKDPRGTFRDNAEGTVNLTEAIIKHQPSCRLMFCSTSEIYGAVPEELGAITENFGTNPMNPYGVSKAAADHYVLERARSLKLPFFVTRAFSHTGLRRGNNFSISSDAYQIARIKKGLQEPVINVGNLGSRRVVMDVKDCVRAYYLLMQHEPAISGEAFNIGGEGLFNMEYFLDKMIEIAGLQGQVKKKVDPRLVRPIDIPIQVPDSSKARDLTGWKPLIPIDETLTGLLNYWMKKIN